MLNIFSAVLIFIALNLSLFASDKEQLPTLDEIKRMHVEGSFGSFNLNNLNSIFASGRILYYAENDTTERSFRIFKKRPNKYRSYYETKVAKKNVQLEVIFDGEAGIQIFSHDGREVYRERLEGDSLEAIRFESRLEGPLLLVMEENKEFLRIVEYQNIEGIKCILITVDPRSKYPYRNIWLSADNFQEIKYDRIKKQDGVDILEENYNRDFKTIQGILFASRSDKFVNSKRIYTTFVDEFNINHGLYDSLFNIDSK